MFQELNKKYEKDISSLANTPDLKKEKKFKQYCQKMIDQYENEIINIHELGYLIANAIQYPILTKNDAINEIITLGAEIELPEDQQSQNVNKNYQKLKKFLKNLSNISKGTKN